jgi:hypothetical protein
MARNVMLGVGALVLAIVLSTACGALWLQLSGTQDLMREVQLGVRGEAIRHAIEQGRDPEQAFGAALRWIEFGVLPFSLAVAGIFVGLFTRGRAWPVIAIALSPLLITYVAGRSWGMRPWFVAGSYLLGACLVGQATVAMRARMRS